MQKSKDCAQFLTSTKEIKVSKTSVAVENATQKVFYLGGINCKLKHPENLPEELKSCVK